MNPTRLGVNRPAKGLGGYLTPVEGLYLAGAGSHPGGTVNGWCGRLAAETALADSTRPAHRAADAGQVVSSWSRTSS
jgi:phytoene dehydrogenase-like protein